MAADGGDKATVKWLHAVRCVVAVVVTALAIAVAVTSIRIVLRPEELQLKISNGSVLVTNNTASRKLRFSFDIKLGNPSGRAIVSFSSVSVTILNGTSPPPPGVTLPTNKNILEFSLNVNLTAVQHTTEVTTTKAIAKYEEVNEIYLNSLLGGNVIHAMMRLDGFVGTKVWLNRGHPDTYYCYPLIVAIKNPTAPAAATNDVFCIDNTPQRGWKK